MLFDSPVFFAFLAIVVPLYWLLPHRQQNLLLLVASYFFYGWWDYRFLALILISTIVDFFCAKFIAESTDPRTRKLLLALSVTVNLTFLGFFKYFNFFVDSLAPVLSSLGLPVPTTVLRIVLPPGISFYTFQELAYIVDVYYRRLPPAKSLVDYALFISLFPHLIAGPIQRPSHLLPQVQKPRTFVPATVFDGLMLILTGLFRKSVIADNAALLTNAAFDGKLGGYNTMSVLIGTYAFAWQIYGDFSGYSDIARGSAQLMGFHFMVNFRQPYLATSLQDFWRRWHISLSTWLRDYLYIPLGGNQRGEGKTYRNLMTTMLLGGLWHGANWTFVVWGGIHGAILSLERLARGAMGTVRRGALGGPWLRRVIVFHVVCVAWIFFRATSIRQAFTMIAALTHWVWLPEFRAAMIFLAALTIPLFALDIALERRAEEYPSANAQYGRRLATAAALLGMLFLFSGNEPNAFIYFQF